MENMFEGHNDWKGDDFIRILAILINILSRIFVKSDQLRQDNLWRHLGSRVILFICVTNDDCSWRARVLNGMFSRGHMIIILVEQTIAPFLTAVTMR